MLHVFIILYHLVVLGFCLGDGLFSFTKVLFFGLNLLFLFYENAKFKQCQKILTKHLGIISLKKFFTPPVVPTSKTKFFTRLLPNFAEPPAIPPTPSDPCYPSPCGANARCRVEYGSAVCTCEPEYHGNPYEGCRPECLVSSDCPMARACIRNRYVINL